MLNGGHSSGLHPSVQAHPQADHYCSCQISEEVLVLSLLTTLIRDVPKEEHLLKLKNRLFGVELVAVDRSDLMECWASESTDSQ